MPEKGSAVAEFVFVSTLVMVICAAIFQLAFALHLRNTIIDSAGEGARYAALNNSSLSVGIVHTQKRLAEAIPAHLSTSVTGRFTYLNEVEVIEIEVTSALPLLIGFGPKVIRSTGHAVVE